MRIGILSDSHGDMSQLKRAILSMGAVDVILHAGDFYEDARKIESAFKVKVIGVMGNCDHLVSGPIEKVIEVGGKSILLTHGHQYGVKRDRKALMQRAGVLDVNAVIFGHTHVAETFWVEKTLFMNPGSCRYGRADRSLSYGTLDIGSDGTMTPAIHCIE